MCAICDNDGMHHVKLYRKVQRGELYLKHVFVGTEEGVGVFRDENGQASFIEGRRIFTHTLEVITCLS